MNRRKSTFRIFGLLAAVVVFHLIGVREARAQWQATGVPVAVAAGTQQHPTIVSDGSGGAIFTWIDSRNSATFDIYAQRLNAAGTADWASNGIPMCTAPDQQYNCRTVSDGIGGMLVVWDDYRDGANWHVYAQKVDRSGQVAWTANGAPVFTGTNAYATQPDIAPDGAGGAFVVWADYRIGLRVYAQHLDAAGNPLWVPNGMELSSNGQYFARVLSDGTGGAFIAWGYGDVYAQRVDAAGSVLWSSAGVAICTAPYEQREPQIASDSAGGIVIAWTDYRSETPTASYPDIYAQRVSLNGATLWQGNGVPVCVANDEQARPALVGDGAGGAICTWRDARALPGLKIYAQHLNGSGTALWGDTGLPICTTAVDSYQPQIVTTGQGHSVIAWQANAAVYAQHLDDAGTVLWAADGVVPTPHQGGQTEPAIVADGRGGVIIGWADYRSGAADIYAQRVLVMPISCPEDRTISPGAQQRFTIDLHNATSTAGWGYYAINGDAQLTFEMEDDPNGFVPSLVSAMSIEPNTSVTLPAWVRVGGGALPGDDLQFQIVRGFGAESPDTCTVTVHVGSNTTGVGGATPLLPVAQLTSVPNPFSSSTRLQYVVPESAGEVSLSVYDAAGRHVRTLARRAIPAGEHAIEWNGADEHNTQVPSGVYFGVLRGRGFAVTTKLILLH